MSSVLEVLRLYSLLCIVNILDNSSENAQLYKVRQEKWCTISSFREDFSFLAIAVNMLMYARWNFSSLFRENMLLAGKWWNGIFLLYIVCKDFSQKRTLVRRLLFIKMPPCEACFVNVCDSGKPHFNMSIISKDLLFGLSKMFSKRFLLFFKKIFFSRSESLFVFLRLKEVGLTECVTQWENHFTCIFYFNRNFYDPKWFFRVLLSSENCIKRRIQIIKLSQWFAYNLSFFYFSDLIKLARNSDFWNKLLIYNNKLIYRLSTEFLADT